MRECDIACDSLELYNKQYSTHPGYSSGITADGAGYIPHLSYTAFVIDASLLYGGGKEPLMKLAPMKNCDHRRELGLGETV